MSFVGIMMAVFCGIVLYDLVQALLKTVINMFNHREGRKIGFGDEAVPEKRSKGAQMRKIGFGEND